MIRILITAIVFNYGFFQEIADSNILSSDGINNGENEIKIEDQSEINNIDTIGIFKDNDTIQKSKKIPVQKDSVKIFSKIKTTATQKKDEILKESKEIIQGIEIENKKREYHNDIGLFFKNVSKKDSIAKIVSIKTVLRETVNNYITVIQPEQIKKSRISVISYIVLVVLAILIWIKLFHQKYLQNVFRAVFNAQISGKIFREKNVITKRGAFILNILFVLIASIFIYMVFDINRIILLKIESDFIHYLIICGIIFAVLISRLFVMRLIGSIFNCESIVQEYLHNLFLIYKNLGIYLFPVIILMIFIPGQFIWIPILAGILLIIFAFIIRILKGIQIVFKKDVLLVYLILYLCTLEILPVLIGYKLLKGLI